MILLSSYEKPVNLFVAGFIGSPQMNFINSRLEKMSEGLYVVFKITVLSCLKPNQIIGDYIDKVILGIRWNTYDEEFISDQCQLC